MDSGFKKGVKTPVFNVECGAELEGESLSKDVIGAGLRYKEGEGVKSRKKAEAADYD